MNLIMLNGVLLSKNICSIDMDYVFLLQQSLFYYEKDIAVAISPSFTTKYLFRKYGIKHCEKGPIIVRPIIIIRSVHICSPIKICTTD